MSDKIVMVIDDDKSNLAVIIGYLEEHYKVVPAVSGESAIKRLERVTPDLILLDNMMPGMSGLEVLDYLKLDQRLCHIPVIIVTSEHDATVERDYFVHGAADFIAKPLASGVLLERIKRCIEYWELRNNLEKQIRLKSREKEEVLFQSIKAIANTIDAKDAYTKGHSERVAKYSAMIAEELGWEPDRVQLLYNIALLHDIGKIGIPDSILNKPGRLSDQEFSIIKQHTVTGGEILKDIHSMQSAYTAARYHHERFDGKGYPNGLKGEEIPLIARVIAVADAYDAMTSNRVYRKRLSDEIVMEELKKGMGTQFDPEIAGVFTDILVKNNFFRKDDGSEEGDMRVKELLDRQRESDDYEMTYDCVSGLFRVSHAMDLIEQISLKEEWTFCLMDVGNFRQVNDVYGRIQGDYVLSVTADIIQKNLAEQDIAYRACGGVFGACLREQSDPEAVREFVERVIADYRERREQVAVMRDTDISVGICMTKDSGHNFHQIYRNADCALFYTKQLGSVGYYFYQNEPTQWERVKEQGIVRLTNCLFSEENRRTFCVIGNVRLIENLDCIADYIRKQQNSCTVVLFELDAIGNSLEEYECASNSMNNLELAVTEQLQEKDLGIRFSSSQYVVVLTEDVQRSAKEWCDSVVRQYYRLDSSSRFELEFEYMENVQE